MKRVLLGAVLSALVCLPASAQPEPVPRELVSRLLRGYGPEAPALYVGELPPDERLEQLALPEGARVVGSTAYRDAVPSSATVYVSVQGDVADALRFFDTRLPQAGWERRQDEGYVQAGFLPDDAALPEVRGFCKGDVVLDLSARQGVGETELDIGFYGADPQYSPCRPSQEPASPPLPPLRAPAGSLMLDYEPGYGRYEGLGTSSIALESDLDALEVRTSYDRQLAEAGWQPQADGQDGPVTWSQWTFRARGATWSGLLNVLSDPAFPDRHLAQLLVVQR